MLVMGAYGHSRFREAISGAVPRGSSHAGDETLPVLMAH